MIDVAREGLIMHDAILNDEIAPNPSYSFSEFENHCSDLCTYSNFPRREDDGATDFDRFDLLNRFKPIMEYMLARYQDRYEALNKGSVYALIVLYFSRHSQECLEHLLNHWEERSEGIRNDRDWRNCKSRFDDQLKRVLHRYYTEKCVGDASCEPSPNWIAEIVGKSFAPARMLVY